MEATRCQLLASGRHPKVTLVNECKIKALTYTFCATEHRRGQCVIHSMPQDADEVPAFLRNINASEMGIVYKGQGMAGVTYAVLLRLLKQKRVYLTPDEKRALLELHEHRCALCGAAGPFEFTA